VNAAPLSLLVAAATGVAAMLLQLAWLRVAVGALPGTLPATALVVPAFLAAWTAGAAVAGRLADRTGAADLLAAARWLGAAAVCAFLAPRVLELLASGEVPPVDVLERLLVGAAPVVPAAFLLGGALPLLARVRHARGCPPWRASGGVMAAVALGAALGCAGAVAPAVLAFGAIDAAAATLAVAGLAAWGLAVTALAPAPATAPSAREDVTDPGGRDLVLVAAAGGAVLVGGEAVLLRVHEQRWGGSLTTLAELLGALHLGMALGAATLACWRGRVAPRACLGLLLALAACGLVYGPAWAAFAPTGPRGALLLVGLLGFGAGNLVTAASAIPARPRGRFGSWVGDLAAWSTAGGALGGALVVHGLVPDPDVGTPGTLVRLAGAALAAGLLVVVRPPWGGAFRVVALGGLLAAGLGLAWGPRYALPWRTPGGGEVELLARREGAYGVVSLVRTADGSTRLKLDNRAGLGGTGEGAALERRLGRLAAALAPGAARALVLGLGRGQTLVGCAAATPAEVTCVERNAQVLALDLPLPFGPDQEPRGGPPRVLHADARAHLARHPAAYDLVVGDLFFPWTIGAGALLAREEFVLVRRALTADGVFVQWLPLHQLSWPAFGSVARAFVEAFPTARLFVATPLAGQPVVALVGGLERLPADEEVDALLAASPTTTGPFVASDLHDLYVADAWTLERHFEDAPVNTARAPWSEWISQRREGDETRLSIINLRRLAELAVPLETVAVSGRPGEPTDIAQMGMALRGRSLALVSLLRARALWLELIAEGDGWDAVRRAAEQDRLDVTLLAAWRASPGRPDARVALLERASQHARADRLPEAARLLRGALEELSDAALVARLGAVLIGMERPQDARHVLAQGRELFPADPRIARAWAQLEALSDAGAGAPSDG